MNAYLKTIIRGILAALTGYLVGIGVMSPEQVEQFINVNLAFILSLLPYLGSLIWGLMNAKKTKEMESKLRY